MKNSKQIGICMDHSIAFLLEITNSKIIRTTISSEFTHDDKVFGFHKNENQMHTKEKSLLLDYYKKISAVILQFNEVILFGPTDAKTELLNILKVDHLFANIKIDIKNTDKMGKYNQYLFVNDYFNRV
jgi:stalled ribosome rescue protein Dom34